MGRIWPGTLVANATMPDPPLAVYSVMNRLPPATARFTAPNMPLAPALPDAAVSSSMGPVIHESSPPSATIDSPAASCISSTGMVVPITLWSMSVAALRLGIEGGTPAVDGAPSHDAVRREVVGQRRGGWCSLRPRPRRRLRSSASARRSSGPRCGGCRYPSSASLSSRCMPTIWSMNRPETNSARRPVTGCVRTSGCSTGGNSAHDPLGDLFAHVARHTLVEVGAGVVSHGQLAAQVLHHRRQRVVGGEQARPHRVATPFGDHLGVEHRVRGRLGHPGDVGVPAVGVGRAVGGVLDGRRERRCRRTSS